MAKKGLATQMTPAEIEAFLDAQRTLLFVTIRRDGSPVAHPLWFTKLGENVYVNTRRDSLKFRNVSRDPRVCAVVEAGETYFELRGVRIEARCQRVEDPDEISRVEAAQAEKDRRIESGMGEAPEWLSESRSRRLDRGERVLLRIPIERIYTWDFSKLRAHYARPGLPRP
jgi:hypothetical protein